MTCGCNKQKEDVKTVYFDPNDPPNESPEDDDRPRSDDPIIQRRFWDSVKGYAAACYEWYKAGKPSRTPEEMEQCFGICEQCPHFIQIDDTRKRGRCAVCGCYLGVNPHRFLQGNKIAMKTQQCPEGKWK